MSTEVVRPTGRHLQTDDAAWPLLRVNVPASTTLPDAWIDEFIDAVERAAARGSCVVLCDAPNIPLPNPAQRRRLANTVAQMRIAYGVDAVRLVLITPFPMVMEGLVRAVAWLVPEMNGGNTPVAIDIVDTAAEGAVRARRHLAALAQRRPTSWAAAV